MSKKDSKTVSNSMEETKEYHVRYLRAVNNPIRREILRILKERDMTIEDLCSKTKLDAKNLTWHLELLEYGFCVMKINIGDVLVYSLTQEGKVVDYIEK